MRSLAKFEGYLDQFAITESVLAEHVFKTRSVQVLVAENSDQRLVGMLVFYFLPFTYDATPWLFIKELYVEPEHRGQAIGEQLMRKAARICQDTEGQKMVWSVLSENKPAQRFYQRLGGQHDHAWLPFSLGSNEINTLAGISR